MEYKNTIIDTNIWVSFFNEEDENHNKTRSFQHLFFNEQIIPDLVFYETLTVLKNKVKDNIILDKFKNFATESEQVTIKLFYENNRDVLNLFIREKKGGLSYVDTLLLYLSKEYYILTFDKELTKRIKESGGLLA
jgi:predicted nucleic acid-binding protein